MLFVVDFFADRSAAARLRCPRHRALPIGPIEIKQLVGTRIFDCRCLAALGTVRTVARLREVAMGDSFVSLKVTDFILNTILKNVKICFLICTLSENDCTLSILHKDFNDHNLLIAVNYILT